MDRQSILGHSMGGHGALTIGLRNPGRFKAISAFAPIVSSSNCPWGQKALGAYLGPDQASWRAYDACALIEDGARAPELLEAACAKAGIALTLRRQAGYDHSYYFISSFIEDQLRWHAARLA